MKILILVKPLTSICYRLVEKEQEHSASLSEAVTALRQDELKKLNDTIEKMKLENEVYRCI